MHRVCPLPGMRRARSGSRCLTPCLLLMLRGIRGSRLLPVQYLRRDGVDRGESTRDLTLTNCIHLQYNREQEESVRGGGAAG
jgi:hypothetical protein